MATRPARRAGSEDAGFSLVEVIVALGVVLVVMLSASSFFLRSLAGAALQRQRQAAVALADQALERARAVPADDLRDGRTLGKVLQQYYSAPTTLKPDDWQTQPVYDGQDVAAALPLTEQQVSAEGTRFTIRAFLGRCWRSTASSGDCGATERSDWLEMYRVTVSVVWAPGRGMRCGLENGICEVAASTLVDANGKDPVFTKSG